jgi:hypothetical protein
LSFHSISIYGKISARIGLIRTAGIGKGYVRDHAPRLLNATPFFKVAHPRQASPRLFFRRHRKEGIMWHSLVLVAASRKVDSKGPVEFALADMDRMQ